MNYKSIYNRITTTARTLFSINSDSLCSWRTAYNRMNPTEYKELHHIIPRGMGGEDIETNYCMLTPREHFLVHKLLTKIYPNNRSVIVAFFMMSGMNNKYSTSLTSREYNIIRNKCSYYNKGVNNPCSHKIGALNHFYGKHHTQETIDRAILTRSKNTYAIEQSSNRMRLYNKQNIGSKNYMYGKQHTSQTKLSIIETDIRMGKTRPFIYNNQLFLSLHIASNLLQYNRKSIARLIKQRDENKYIESSEFFDSYNIYDFEWQVDPSNEMIEKLSTLNSIYLNSIKNELKTIAWNKSIRLLNSYIESEYNNLDTYAKSIGMSDCGLAYQFKRFPQYTTISNGCKQFTKEKAIELLNSIA